jgi:hypothetical protein
MQDRFRANPDAAGQRVFQTNNPQYFYSEQTGQMRGVFGPPRPQCSMHFESPEECCNLFSQYVLLSETYKFTRHIRK